MKGKTNIGIELSKTEMLAIGTEVEILDSLNGYAGVVYRCKLPKGKQVMINSNKVDITDYSPYIDWEQRRYEIAKAAMQGILCAPIVEGIDPNPTPWELARISVRNADALIKELKKGE
jgi:hypothetical protein